MLGERSGCHHQDGVGIHVARSARSYRLPKPRFDPTVYYMRSTCARFDEPSGHSEWRELARDVDTKTLQNAQGLIGRPASVLITFFRKPGPSPSQKKASLTEGCWHGVFSTHSQ